MALSHEDMLNELKLHISKEFKQHVQDYHNDSLPRDFGIGDPISVNQLVREHMSMKSDLEEIAEAFLGKRMSPLMGGGRDRSGIVDLVRENSRQLRKLASHQQNGTMKLKLPAPVWAAIITTIGLLLVAVIGKF